MQEDARAHRSSRSWLIAGLIFAVVATALLVLSDDARWLRLGIVAALWAALLGGFLATHYRRQADRATGTMEDAQAMYELELEREIAARREYELEVEADVRQDAQDSARQEIDALRGEVVMLRETLQKLFGGEVLYERVALTAQSTRMRSLSEDPKPKTITAAAEPRNGDRPSVVAGSPSRPYDKMAEQRTEMIARVLDPEPVRAAEPARREPPRTPQAQSLRRPESAAQPHRRRPEDSRNDLPVAQPPRREPPRRAPEPQRPGPEGSRSDLPAASLPRRAPESPRRQEPRSWFGAEPESTQSTPPSERPSGSSRSAASVNGARAGRHGANGTGPTTGRHGAGGGNGVQPSKDPAESGDLSAAMAEETPSATVNRTLPPEVRGNQRPGGRRRKPESDEAPGWATAPAEPPAHSRHSPADWLEPETPSSRSARSDAGRWDDLPSLNRMPSLEPEPEPEGSGGSHAGGSGRSVAELLAAYGSDDTPRRRRRKD